MTQYHRISCYQGNLLDGSKACNRLSCLFAYLGGLSIALIIYIRYLFLKGVNITTRTVPFIQLKLRQGTAS